MTLAHGAGTGMHHSFMIALANTLAENGIATLRFNFPFMENKKGPADKPAVAHQTIAAAIAKAKELLPACINGIHFQNPSKLKEELQGMGIEISKKKYYTCDFCLFTL